MRSGHRAGGRLRVLQVAAEVFPWVKTGGLGDVMGALPPALARTGTDVRLVLPGLPALLEAVGNKRLVGTVGPAPGADRVDVLCGTLPLGPGLEAYLIDAPHRFGRPGDPYLGPDGRDWPDNHLRFALLGWVAAGLALGRIDPHWRADVLHAHDWHAGLASAYLRAASSPVAAGSLFTIHNLAFQGLFAANTLAELQLPASMFTPEGIEFYGQVSFMKAGVCYSDRISTVSPGYAREIQTPAFGCGLDGLMRARSDALSGILNGVDPAVWNAEKDRWLADHYSAGDLGGKARVKSALQREFGLDERPDAIVFGVVSRLTEQKGMDLLMEALPALLGIGGQLALLGGGEAAIERDWREAAAGHGGRVGVRFAFDEGLAHRIIAGADVILVPSRFEPCGLTQLYGLRYGTLPLVRRVGGLGDTVVDATFGAVAADVATGFVFEEPTAAALAAALHRVGGTWHDRTAWERLMRRAMAQDFSWERAAAAYRQVYDALLARGVGAAGI